MTPSSDLPMISLADPVLGDAEKQAIADVIDSGWITMGDRVRAFESTFADLHGLDDAVAVSSCTAGLHLCLAALNIGPGDEVLVPSLTFVATVNAVRYVGATPVFVDIEDLHTPHISLADAAAKCTSRARAVVVMHYAGFPVDMPAWREFADANDLHLIEDSAHAIAVDGIARLSDASVFSFFSNKNMTTAEGGMVLSPDSELLQRVRCMRSHGMTTGTLDRHRGHAHSYDVVTLGYNYRMDELRAALGLAQLGHIRDWNAQRRHLMGEYRRQLAERIPEAVSVPFSADRVTAGHLMPVLLPDAHDRSEIMTRLRQLGIQTSIHYPPAHQFSYYTNGHAPTVLPQTEEFCARELTLPLHPSLDESAVNRVVNSLRSVMSEKQE